MHFQHDTDVGLVQLRLASEQHSVDLPALWQLATHSEGVYKRSVDWQIRMDASLHHLLQNFVCHLGVLLPDIDLHQRSIEILAFSEL